MTVTIKGWIFYNITLRKEGLLQYKMYREGLLYSAYRQTTERSLPQYMDYNKICYTGA